MRIGEMNRKIKGKHRGSQNKETEKAIYFSNMVNCGGKKEKKKEKKNNNRMKQKPT